MDTTTKELLRFELVSDLGATRNQATYFSIEEIVELLKEVFKEEISLIKEKL
jgi:hypothetical protein